MERNFDEKGRAAYACAAGETVFWRRQAKQFTSTLAFMLGRDEGKVYRVRASELEPLRECLNWLRANTPYSKFTGPRRSGSALCTRTCRR